MRVRGHLAKGYYPRKLSQVRRRGHGRRQGAQDGSLACPCSSQEASGRPPRGGRTVVSASQLESAPEDRTDSSEDDRMAMIRPGCRPLAKHGRYVDSYREYFGYRQRSSPILQEIQANCLTRRCSLNKASLTFPELRSRTLKVMGWKTCPSSSWMGPQGPSTTSTDSFGYYSTGNVSQEVHIVCVFKQGYTTVERTFLPDNAYWIHHDETRQRNSYESDEQTNTGWTDNAVALSSLIGLVTITTAFFGIQAAVEIRRGKHWSKS